MRELDERAHGALGGEDEGGVGGAATGRDGEGVYCDVEAQGWGVVLRRGVLVAIEVEKERRGERVGERKRDVRR